MENSITATRINGKVILFSTSAMMIKIAAIETVLTTLKSSSVISIRSFVQGASPISIPAGSYFFKIAFSSAIWAFTSSLAVLYSEFTSKSSHLSLFSTLLMDCGIISSGTREPSTDSIPSAYLMPSTASISASICRTSCAGTLAFTSTICVAPTPKLSCSFVLAITYSISFGRLSPKS